MDKNAIIGMLLMGAVIFGFMWLNQPSEAELAQRRAAIEQAAEDAAMRDADTALGVTDTVTAAEIATLKTTVQQFGVAVGEGDEAVYTLSSGGVTVTLDGGELSGEITLDGGSTGSLAEALAPKTANVAFHNRLVAKVRETIRNYTRNGTFANFLNGKDSTLVLENEVLRVELSSRGGQISGVTLKDYADHKNFNEDGKNPVRLFDASTNSYSFILNTHSQRFDTKDFYFTPMQLNDSTVVMQLDLGGGSKFGIRYVLPAGRYDVEMDVLQEQMDKVIPANIPNLDFAWSQKMSRHEAGRMFEERNSALYYKYAGGDVDYLSETGDDDEQMPDKLKWVGFKNQFFSSILICKTYFNGGKLESRVIPTENIDNRDYLKSMSMESSLDYNSANPMPASFNFYFGPNLYPLLSSYDEMISPDEDLHLTKVIPLGWPLFRWINTGFIIPVFNFLGSFIPSYGIIILIMTILIKLILWPLAHKSYKSQARMRFLAPDIKKLNEKYPDKEQAMQKQQKMMELYRQAGANPMGGCLPMLLQFPILIAMFTFFPSCIELRGQSFLWVKDLSAPDAIVSWDAQIPFITNYFGNHISLFCLLMTVTNVIYTRINMQNQAGGQSMPGMKMMAYLMPIMFLVFFNNYAAGLSYYYFVSLLITIMQTYAYRHFVSESKMRAMMAENAKKPKKKSGFMARLEEAQRQQQAMLAEQQRRKNNNGKGRH